MVYDVIDVSKIIIKFAGHAGSQKLGFVSHVKM